jgi:hypothetical protein
LRNIFATPAYLDGPAHRLKEQAAQVGGRFVALIDQLVEVGDGRVAAMDAAGVTMQALSLTAPGVEQLDVEEAKLPADVSRAPASGWRRPHHVFDRPSLSIDGRGPRFSRPAASQRR